MRRLFHGMALVLALAVPAVASAQAVNRLDFVARPRLIKCKDAPCFRVDLNAVDANDQPLSIDTQGPLDRWKVLRDGVPQKVFYVTAKEGAGAKTTGKGRFLLLLIDVSGSMNQRVPGTTDTRFTAAKKALSSWASSLKDGVDHVAIVPFESHRVVPTISMATFADSSARVRGQIDDLPVPRETNNTALYSAVVSGLDMLEPHRRAGEDPVLLVFTDGENDVRPPPRDDAGLLGQEGLKIARDAAYRAGVPLFTIGFGAPGQASFNEPALRSLAYPDGSNYSKVSTGEELEQVLEKARRKLASGVQLLVGPVAESKAQLTNQTVNFKVSYTSGGQTLETVKDTPWVTGGMTEPAWEGQLEPGPEYQAFLDTSAAPESSSLTPFKRPLVLLMYGAILALLWFGIPRIVWPERYLARPAAPPPSSARPPAPAWAPPQRPGPPPPPGGSRQPQRGPAPKGGETMYADPRGGGRQAPPPPESTVYIRPDTGKFRPPDKPGPKR